MALASCKPHFLLLPMPEQGHFTPMLSLASRLASLGCTITFLKALKAPFSSSPKHTHNASRVSPHRSLSESGTESSAETQGDNTQPDTDAVKLQFRTLPLMPGLSSQPIDAESSRFEITKHTLAGLEDRQGLVEKMVEESKASEAPITCIICDFFLCRWVVNVAKRQGIRVAVLVPMAAINVYVPYLLTKGRREEGEELLRKAALLGPNKSAMTEIPMTAAAESEEQKKKTLELSNLLQRCHEGSEEASHILMNSFEQLESAILESMAKSELPIRFIGPCLPTWEDARDSTSSIGDIMAKQAGCLHTEDPGCLSWLEKQEKGSVLLVSFGSEVYLEAEQVQELAMGLESSGCKFLWVVRADAPANCIPAEDFCERTRERGMCVPWVPQRKVLQHGAIGGFLTHCGWNSTMESIVYGVPMLCVPMQGDQYSNARLIHRFWKVGMPLGGNDLQLGNKRKVVARGQVDNAIRTLMSSEELHRNSLQLQQQAQAAIAKSKESLSSFVKENCNSFSY